MNSSTCSCCVGQSDCFGASSRREHRVDLLGFPLWGPRQCRCRRLSRKYTKPGRWIGRFPSRNTQYTHMCIKPGAPKRSVKHRQGTGCSSLGKKHTYGYLQSQIEVRTSNPRLVSTCNLPRVVCVSPSRTSHNVLTYVRKQKKRCVMRRTKKQHSVTYNNM